MNFPYRDQKTRMLLCERFVPTFLMTYERVDDEDEADDQLSDERK